MARKPPSFDDADLCAIGRLSWNDDLSVRRLADYRSPRLNVRTALLVLRRMERMGLLTKTTRGRFQPTREGWNQIEKAVCKR